MWNNEGGRLALCRVNAWPYELLTLIRLPQWIAVYDAEEEALQALADEPTAPTPGSGRQPTRLAPSASNRQRKRKKCWPTCQVSTAATQLLAERPSDSVG